MVFKHEIDPSIPDPMGELQDIHGQSQFSPSDTLIRC